MNAKQYLSQLRSLDRKIAARMEEVKRLKAERTFLQGVSYDRDRVQTSATGNAQFERLADIITDTERKVVELARLRHRIMMQIEAMDKPEHTEILQLRYVENERFEAIACTMGYTYSWTVQLHGHALQAFYNKWLKPQENGV